MNWLDTLPSELVAEIYSIVKAQAHSEVLGELCRVKHSFAENVHTIDYSGIDNGVKYVSLQLSEPKCVPAVLDDIPGNPTIVEVETTVTHYYEPDNEDTNHLGAAVVVTSNSGEQFRIL